jgi:lactoylglutathione lyase
MAEPTVEIYGTRLLVRDFSATYRFYHELLGLESRSGNGEPPYAELFAGERLLALFEAGPMGSALGLPGAVERAGDAFAVIFKVPDVDRWYVRLKAQGVPFVTPPTDRPAWGLRTIHLRDPEGNLVEIYHDLPRLAAARPRRPRRPAAKSRRRTKHRR